MSVLSLTGARFLSMELYFFHKGHTSGDEANLDNYLVYDSVECFCFSKYMTCTEFQCFCTFRPRPAVLVAMHCRYVKPSGQN